MLRQNILLGVVEIGLIEFYAWVAFVAWDTDRPEMAAIILQASLHEDASGLDPGRAEGH